MVLDVGSDVVGADFFNSASFEAKQIADYVQDKINEDNVRAAPDTLDEVDRRTAGVVLSDRHIRLGTHL